MGTDWTAAWRVLPQLSEYIVVGEAWNGCCGCNWNTWGNPAYRPDGADDAPPYERDGFAKTELEALSRSQISRYDCAAFVGNSRTFSFKRA